MQFCSRLLVLLTFVLTGCGFHLRGMVDAESLQWLDNVAIVIQQAHQDLAPLLREQLKAYNIKVTTDPALAQYWLIIDHENTVQNISSISSSTTPRQYEVTYKLNYKLQRTKGGEIIPSSQIAITRQITLNSDRILGSKDEEELQKSEMRRDAVIQLFNRLSRTTPEQLRKSQPVKKVHY